MPPELFYKKSFSWKFHSIYKRTPVLKSLLTLLKKALTQMFSCEYWEISKNTYFEEQVRTAISEVT